MSKVVRLAAPNATTQTKALNISLFLPSILSTAKAFVTRARKIKSVT